LVEWNISYTFVMNKKTKYYGHYHIKKIDFKE
jgi:hypothetical protein